MEKYKLAVTFLAMTLSLGACSSSSSVEDEEAGTEELATADAGTDALPPEAGSEQASVDSLTGDQSLDSLPLEDPAAMPPAETQASNDAPPASEPLADPVAAAPTGETTDYVVKAGDTLMKIAFENYGDLYQWKKIYEGNQDKIHDMNRLSAGTVLKLEKASVSIDRNGEKYLIKTGDTLGRISDDVYGTERKWRKIYENNRQLIKNPNQIYAGFYLYYVMTEQDHLEKEEFLKHREPAPLAQAAPEAAPSQQVQQQAAAGGLIDAGTAGGMADENRAPSAAPAK